MENIEKAKEALKWIITKIDWMSEGSEFLVGSELKLISEQLEQSISYLEKE